MEKIKLSVDPYNLIITGVGGQGNVLASRVIGDILSQSGLFVTIGETFGASQRGGSVMSHLRISAKESRSPQIPRGKAHMIVALEPVEGLRVLKMYGNPTVNILCNTRPIQPIGVICGEQSYPSLENMKNWISALSKKAWFIETADEALKMGNPILGNIMSVGALAATNVLPIEKDRFFKVIQEKMPVKSVEINMEAFEKGMRMIFD